MAFGSLLGGIVTLIGTSPNIIVSRVRAEMLGEPFRMFDFAPVGLGIAIVGVIFLAFGYRLLPKDRQGAANLDEALNIKDYVTEARVPADAEITGKTVADLLRMGNGDVKVAAIIRNETRSASPLPDSTASRKRPADAGGRARCARECRRALGPQTQRRASSARQGGRRTRSASSKPSSARIPS